MTNALMPLDGLKLLDRKQAALFAASCATRVSYVFISLAKETPPSEMTEWVDQLWSQLPTLSAERARVLEERVWSVPEANVDDSHLPEYWAMRALGVLHDALHVVFEEDLPEWTLSCSRSALALLSDMDFYLRPNEYLQSLEYAAQEAVLAQLTDANQELPTAESCRSSVVFKNLATVTGRVVATKLAILRARETT